MCNNTDRVTYTNKKQEAVFYRPFLARRYRPLIRSHNDFVGELGSVLGLKRPRFKLGVVSDGVRLRVWMRLNEAGLDGYLDSAVTYDDTGKRKPAKPLFSSSASSST